MDDREMMGRWWGRRWGVKMGGGIGVGGWWGQLSRDGRVGEKQGFWVCFKTGNNKVCKRI